MIRRLRIKFIAIIMALLVLLLIIIFSTLNITMTRMGEAQSYEMMEQIAEGDGKPALPSQNSGRHREELSPFPGQFNMSGMYYVKLDGEGSIFELFVPYEDYLTIDDADGIVAVALAQNKQRGSVGGQLYLIQEKPYGRIIVFSDGRAEDVIMQRLIYVSLAVGGFGVVALFFIALLLSKWAVKPVETAFEKQRQFVADASHELKTPLTVINTNADVLRSEIGENKWLGYIQSEAARMSRLVNDLLYLARFDHSGNIYEKQRFNLSGAVTGAALPFESVAFEAGKRLETNITEGLFYTGDERRIRQLVAILIDNAVKKSFEGGEITVTLAGDANHPRITVRNEGEGIDEKDIPHIFERFYRCDDSRDRETGGFGLGLAIAQSIAEGHGGRISVVSKKEQWTEFTVSL